MGAARKARMASCKAWLRFRDSSRGGMGATAQVATASGGVPGLRMAPVRCSWAQMSCSTKRLRAFLLSMSPERPWLSCQ